MIPSYANLLILGSALVGKTLTLVLPWENEEDSLESFLETRAEESWGPQGAPPPKPGQSITDYLSNILDGEGEATNEPKQQKSKRQQVEELGPTPKFFNNAHNSSIKWMEHGVTYEILTYDGHCHSGPKPHEIAGDVINLSGQNVTATIGELIGYLWQIREQYNNNLTAREVAYAVLLKNQTVALSSELEATLRNGWVCEVPAGQVEPVRDELRRKLLELNRVQYYIASISGSLVAGAVIAGIQAGISHGTSDVELGTEAWVNSAIGTALTIFVATEFSRFAPRITGAAAWSPLVLWAWSRRQVNRSLQALKQRSGSAGSLAAGGSTTAGAALREGAGPLSTDCLTPEQAATAAMNLMEEGLPPQQMAQQMAQSQVYQHPAGMANIVAGEANSGQCRE